MKPQIMFQHIQFKIIYGLLLIALLALGLFGSYTQGWLTDDCFVSLRYAENWINGHGLVYNPGEYVEGYTNFLWTVMIAALQWLGFDPLQASTHLGLLPYLLLALLLAYLSWSRHQTQGTHFIPLAAIYLLVAEDMQIWASGGLETMLFTFLATASLVSTRKQQPSITTLLGSGVLCAFLVLTRMDGLLLVGVCVLSFWLPNQTQSYSVRIKNIMIFMIPVVSTLCVWLIFKVNYYGEIFPTPFYSKSVMHPYYSQGVTYLLLFLKKNWIIGACACLLPLTAWLLKLNLKSYQRDITILLLGACIYSLYVVHVGGDFMFARRFIPVVPLLLIISEIYITQIKDVRHAALTSVTIIAGAVATISVYQAPREEINGIVEENTFYTDKIHALRLAQGLAIGQALQATDVKLVINLGLLMVAYHSKLPYFVETTGLTQYSIAKQPIKIRGRAGHEKEVTQEWLFENNIHMLVNNYFPEHISEYAVGSPHELIISNIALLTILRYDDTIMDKLYERPDVQFVHIDEIIERTKQGMIAGDLKNATWLYNNLMEFYFKYSDGRRQKQLDELTALLHTKSSDKTPN